MTKRRRALGWAAVMGTCLMAGCLTMGCSGSLVVPKWTLSARSAPPGQGDGSVGGDELVVTASIDPVAMGKQALQDAYGFIETAVNGAVDTGRGVWSHLTPGGTQDSNDER